MSKNEVSKPLYFTGKDDQFIGAVFTCENKDIVIKKKSSLEEIDNWVRLVALKTVDFNTDLFNLSTSNIDTYYNKYIQILYELQRSHYNISHIVKYTLKNISSDIEDITYKRRNIDRDGVEDEFLLYRLEELLRFKKKLVKIKDINRETINKNFITEDDIIKAREYPINSLLEFDRSGFTRCIFHDEDTPSMKYYSKTNTVHCFGCSKSHDSISIYMHQNNVDFINAVKSMSK